MKTLVTVVVVLVVVLVVTDGVPGEWMLPAPDCMAPLIYHCPSDVSIKMRCACMHYSFQNKRWTETIRGPFCCTLDRDVTGGGGGQGAPPPLAVAEKNHFVLFLFLKRVFF